MVICCKQQGQGDFKGSQQHLFNNVFDLYQNNLAFNPSSIFSSWNGLKQFPITFWSRTSGL